MKKILFFALALMFAGTTAYSQCLDFNDGPYINLNQLGGAPCSETPPATVEITAFEIWKSEAYLLDGVQAGAQYTFSACNGVGGTAWPIDFTIVAPSGAVDAFGLNPGSICDLDWTATESGEYTLIVNEAGNCGATTNLQINNGNPAVIYNGGGTCPDPITDCEAGTNEGVSASTICPGDTTTLTVNGVIIPNTPTQGEAALEFTPVDPTNTSGLGGPFILTGPIVAGDNAYTFDNDLGGTLSLNNFPVLEGEWELKVVIRSDAAAAPFDFANRCDSTSSVTVNFLPVGDPSCDPVVCEAGNIADAAPQAVCPGDDVTLQLTGEDIPPSSNYALVWLFQDTTITDSVYVLPLSTASPANYNFTGDLNGFLATNGLDTIPPGVYAAFAGVFDFNANNGAGEYCDFTDNALLLTINAADSPECGGPVPCELPYPQVDPQSLSLVENPNGSLTFSWEPINGQIGCQVQAVVGDIQNPTQVATIIRAGANASSFTANANLLTPFTTYSFRVRCGCQQFPTVIAGPYTPIIDIVYGVNLVTLEAENFERRITADLVSNHVAVRPANPSMVEWPTIVSDAVTPVSGMKNIPAKEVKAERRSTFNVFPNPTTGTVNFEYNAASEGIVNVRVFDMIGKAVNDFTMATNKGENLMTVDLGSLESGIYMIEVREGNKVSVSRVIIE